jgi:hypothetical protein
MTVNKCTLDDYTITSDGEIFNNKTNRKLHPCPNEKGYYLVNIHGKSKRLHRLVAQLFVPNPENKPQVNHIDGDKSNNSASNLEWVTNQENRYHAVKTGLHIHGERCPWSKLSKEDVKFIREHTELSQRQLSKIFHVCQPHISDIRNNVNWK